MTEAPLRILEPDDALALWHWAWEVLHGDREEHWRSRAEVVAGLVDVLTFAACELTLSGRHEWVQQLPELLQLHRDWWLDGTSPRHKCLQSVADLLHQGAPVTKAVEAMARSSDPQVRAALARGLRVAEPKARALLEALTADRDRSVRTAARDRLPPGEPTAWWVGKFDSDPVPRLPQVDDAILEALRTVALFADRDAKARRAMLPALHEALPRLPTPTLFEFVRRFISFEWVADGYAPMVAEVLRRPEGERALWAMIVARLRGPDEWAHLYLVLGQLCEGLEGEPLERLCRGLLQCLVEHRTSKRAEDMARIVEGVLRQRWPKSLDGVPVLDAWQALMRDSPELAEAIRPLLAHRGIDLRPVFGRVLDLAERDGALVDALGTTVGRLRLEERQAFVIRGLRSESKGVRALALRQLTTLPPDPTPGAGQAAFSTYWTEPGLRHAIVSDEGLAEAFCPFLRRQLRAGTLDLYETSATLRAVGRLWGGTWGSEEDEDDDEDADDDEAQADHAADDDAEDPRRTRLRRASAWHQGAPETGPPTEQEWLSWRSLRRQTLAEDPDIQTPRLFQVRPPGPLHPDDREVIDALMERWRRVWSAATDLEDEHGEHIHQTLGIMFGFSGIADPYVVERLEEVVAALDGVDDDLADMFRRRVTELRRALD